MLFRMDGSLENLGMTEIRTANPADAEEIAGIYRPYVEDSVASFELDAPSAEGMAERMAGASEMYPWLVAVGPQGLIGYAYGSQHRSRPAYRFSVEVSVYLEEAARGRGLGRRLVVALLDELATRGFNTALAGTTLPNPSSIACLRRLASSRSACFIRWDSSSVPGTT